MNRFLVIIHLVGFALLGQTDAISCHHCKNKKTIADCLKEGQTKKCSLSEKACFYQESQAYYRYGQWTVSMGCGKKHMRAGCDERMGTLKCVRWCKSKDNCNKLIAKTTKPMTSQSKASTTHQSNDMGAYIHWIISSTVLCLVLDVLTLDDIVLRLAYGANLVETKFET